MFHADTLPGQYMCICTVCVYCILYSKKGECANAASYGLVQKRCNGTAPGQRGGGGGWERDARDIHYTVCILNIFDIKLGGQSQ